MKALATPSIKYLNECFDYDDESGTLKWKVRPIEHFVDEWRMNQSNSRLSGKLVCGVRNGYIVVKLEGVTYPVHRIIWKIVYGVDPSIIDHINGVRSDNRLFNLREVTKHQNGANRGIASNNDSGHTGVSYHSRDCKWQSHITVDYSRIYLGCFETIDIAISARKEAEIKYFGEYRRK